MGIASHLFFSSNDTDKQTLHRRITPSSDQFELQRARWSELANHLVGDLRTRSGCAIRTWLQGSYKYGTQVRPPRMKEEFDIDLGVFFCWSGYAENGAHSASELQSMVQASVIEYARTAEGVRRVEIPPKPRCVRVHYDDGFHVDIPCYHLDPDADERTLAAKDGWEVSDPKAIYKWFKEQFEESIRSRVRRQIRYLKCWAGLKWKIDGGRPSSVLLTVLVSDGFARLSEGEIGSEDDTLRALLRRISTRLKRGNRVRNPVNPEENLNRLSEDEWTAFCEGIDEFIRIAEDACSSDSEIEAADHWSRAFAQFFPMPELSSAIAVDGMGGRSLIPAMRPDVMVSAVSRTNQKYTFSGRNAIGPLPKDCDIFFRLVGLETLPSGTTIEWIVRNEGGEAENTNDLGHLAGVGSTASERSAYNGTHFMDCVLRHNGRIFGVRRIPVSITGLPIPRRNPLSRPSYAALMGRR